MSAPAVAVVGGGPAGLMAAEIMARAGLRVTIYEKEPRVGRKFLLAGRGGLNLTHSEAIEPFLARYGAASTRLRSAVEAFSPAELRQWSEALGQPTFVGSSGRVFPQTFKASPLLRAWLRRLADIGVQLRLRHRWTGWNASGDLTFEHGGEMLAEPVDAVVLALGGASWPRTGSDGAWTDILMRAGIPVSPLKPANCGFNVAWSAPFRDRFEGQPLKRIALSFAGAKTRGDLIVSRSGLEGGAIYALSSPLRDELKGHGSAVVSIALRPDVTAAQMAKRTATPRGKQSLSTFLRKALKLSPVEIGLLREAARSTGRDLGAFSPEEFAALVNAVPVTLTGTMPIGRAISSAGGIMFDGVDPEYMLRQRPGTFVAGEMLDWEAPTGGYLLQACFATGSAAGRGVLQYLAKAADQRSSQTPVRS
jgi:uncharacterized flavoprotein (TIGR03862 family)